MNESRVGCVIIFYNPNISQVKKLVESLENSMISHLVLIDNSSVSIESEFLSFKGSFSNFYYHCFQENKGIAEAQNIGIQKIINEVDFILLLDQDSDVNNSMIPTLLDDYQILLKKNIRLGAIGPSIINKLTGQEYVSRVNKKNNYFEGTNILQKRELISSGMLIQTAVLQDAGLMDASLFIDGVDHEWCWRAALKNYLFAMSTRATMMHLVGEGDRKFLFTTIKIPKPIRTFYQYRNFVILSARKYVPLYWKCSNLFKYAIKYFYYSNFLENGKQYFKSMNAGLVKGFGIIKSNSK